MPGARVRAGQKAEPDILREIIRREGEVGADRGQTTIVCNKLLSQFVANNRGLTPVCAGLRDALAKHGDYFLAGAGAPPEPLKYLKKSELGSTTSTSPRFLKLAR